MSVAKLTSSDIAKWYKYLNRVRTQSGIGLSSISEGSYSAKQTSTRAQALVNNILTTRNSNTFLKVSDYGVTSSNISDGKKIKYDDREDVEDALISLLRICVNQDCATVCTNSGTNSNQKNTNGDCSNTKKSNGTVYTSNKNGLNSNTSRSNELKLTTPNNNGTNKAGAKSNESCSNGMQYVYCGAQNGYDNTNSDGTHRNGTCVNGYGPVMSNGACPKTYCTYGTKANKNCNYGSHTNGYNPDGTSFTTYSNGYSGGSSDGTNINMASGIANNSNGYNSKGTCTNGKEKSGTNSKGTYTNGTNSRGTKSNGCQDQIYKAGTATYAHKDYFTKDEAVIRGACSQNSKSTCVDADCSNITIGSDIKA